jgi:hypothetical protein
MRTTDFCFPLPDYEHPCLVSYRLLSEACASPLTRRACTRDQETGEPGVSRRPVRFGGPFRVDTRSHSSARFRLDRTSGTSVAPERPARAFAWAIFPSRQGRFPRPSVKMGWVPRPEMPSLVWEHPRARVDRYLLERGHVCFRDELGPRRPFTRSPSSSALATLDGTAR